MGRRMLFYDRTRQKKWNDEADSSGWLPQIGMWCVVILLVCAAARPQPAIALPGHAPCHTAYLVESDAKELLIWGDVIHVASTQLRKPWQPSNTTPMPLCTQACSGQTLSRRRRDIDARLTTATSVIREHHHGSDKRNS